MMRPPKLSMTNSRPDQHISSISALLTRQHRRIVTSDNVQLHAVPVNTPKLPFLARATHNCLEDV